GLRLPEARLGAARALGLLVFRLDLVLERDLLGVHLRGELAIRHGLRELRVLVGRDAELLELALTGHQRSRPSRRISRTCSTHSATSRSRSFFVSRRAAGRPPLGVRSAP